MGTLRQIVRQILQQRQELTITDVTRLLRRRRPSLRLALEEDGWIEKGAPLWQALNPTIIRHADRMRGSSGDIRLWRRNGERLRGTTQEWRHRREEVD